MSRLFFILFFGSVLCFGCRGTQGRLMHNGETNKVGSNQAGAEVYNPLVRSTVNKLLARAAPEPVPQVAAQPMQLPKRKVCFISLENASVEELGDFKEHIKQAILEGISQSDQFEIVSDRAVESGLRALSLRPNDLFMRENMIMFTSAM
ncbi:MAG: hypothetical protein LBN39_09400, partial [Planctomycetaceae bacterium]|nr:hypothetical protein [Planctomycetaceae bacterium]